MGGFCSIDLAFEWAEDSDKAFNLDRHRLMFHVIIKFSRSGKIVFLAHLRSLENRRVENGYRLRTYC